MRGFRWGDEGGRSRSGPRWAILAVTVATAGAGMCVGQAGPALSLYSFVWRTPRRSPETA